MNNNNVFERIVGQQIILVDDWIPEPEDFVFKQVKGAIVLPVSSFYNINDDTSRNLDYFVLSTKRCYNSDDVRNHFIHYMNYFEKFYDTDHELVMIYSKLKFLMDYEPSYSLDAFEYDLKQYILSGIIFHKIRRMNIDNFQLNLSYRNNKNPGLQYTDKHGAILMEISLLMVLLIPLLTHYIYVKKIDSSKIKYFLLKIFENIFNIYETDIINKLYETAISTVSKNRDAHPILWNMQNIRSRNTTTHSMMTVANIILQIMPKYAYNQHIIHFNYKSILKNLSYQVIDIMYEFSLISLSSYKRDEDNNSEFDKFEAHLTKQDESLYIQNKVNCKETMKAIEMQYGPYDPNEIEFYRKELSKDGRHVINNFQMNLVFSLFYKYFGDPVSIKAINQTDYIKLIISARRALEACNMVILPYIVSGKMVRLVNRTNINKKELTKLKASKYYPLIQDKYRNEKIEKTILSMIATILSSKIQIIDPYDAELNGKLIEVIPEYICEEILLYINLV